MNQSHQTILVASEPKFCDALSPSPRQIFGHISDEAKAIGKTLAVREYVKNLAGEHTPTQANKDKVERNLGKTEKEVA